MNKFQTVDFDEIRSTPASGVGSAGSPSAGWRRRVNEAGVLGYNATNGALAPITTCELIDEINQSNKTISLKTDACTNLISGFGTVYIHGSTGNDGAYTVTSVVSSGDRTVITVDEALPFATADGVLAL